MASSFTITNTALPQQQEQKHKHRHHLFSKCSKLHFSNVSKHQLSLLFTSRTHFYYPSNVIMSVKKNKHLRRTCISCKDDHFDTRNITVRNGGSGTKAISSSSVVEERMLLKDVIVKDSKLVGLFATLINTNEKVGSDSNKRSKGREVHGDKDRTNVKVSSDNNRSRKSKGESEVRVGVEKKGKKKKGHKVGSPELQLRIDLDMCSKRGDVLGAIELYDLAQREGIPFGQYHYTVLLYLCSSAAAGVLQAAKSGSRNRSVAGTEMSDGVIAENLDYGNKKEGNGNSLNHKRNSGEGKDVLVEENCKIHIDEETKTYVLKRAFEIIDQMQLQKIPLNEAAMTSIARMAMSMGDGDTAFEMVQKMKQSGINPRLRSYGPALFTFCNSGEVEKAFKVEKHMLENGVNPEEPELEALLRASVELGRGEKVYYVLHKLRTSVRQVSSPTADLIERWFQSKEALRLGKAKWDEKLIVEATEKGGGGWHGLGWLGKGKWKVTRASVGIDGVCECCGEKLATIDIDPVETENFAKSVASIAAKRETNSSFQKFQKWLDYHGPFEAVVDGANVGMYSQRGFLPYAVNTVVNAVRHKLPSKKMPLVVVHHKRITGGKMDEPKNSMMIEKWKNADALYPTPTGSNDDWYWLYAAIKNKCLIVTNDEMRDHLFQLLGNDFFPKWKERHQVHFSFGDSGLELRMPPPYSVVIQESINGHWHIPIASETNFEKERTWLCAVRNGSHRQESPGRHNGVGHMDELTMRKKKISASPKQDQIALDPQAVHNNLRSILSTAVRSTLLHEIEAAEILGGCVIDFEI